MIIQLDHVFLNKARLLLTIAVRKKVLAPDSQLVVICLWNFSKPCSLALVVGIFEVRVFSQIYLEPN